ncbi:hypothetical protein PG994_014256 [Apiospora phragmitis]|uniref:Uncharacterized protein n=1 Tax=Apiospora phragmitis TaxID=2905665 RepID=A0ABR1T3U5_9PEZI
MQAEPSYHHLHHLHHSSSGGDTVLSVTVSEPSAPASCFDAASAYSQYPTWTQKEEDIDHHPRQQRRATGLWADWKWELFLLLLSILSFVATAVTLYHLSGNSLESWGGFFLGPNTLVSILAAVSKTSLAFAVSSCVAQAKWNWYRRGQDNLLVFERFDQASKGPWGSFRLLGAIWMRHWSALGALIILVLLAYEPFLQTIITQYGVLDFDHSYIQATTGRCLRLDSGRLNFDGGGGGGGVFYPDVGAETRPCSVPDWPRSQPDFGMTAAVYSGFQSITEKQKLNAKCADISKHIERQPIEYIENGNENVSSVDNMCSGANYLYPSDNYTYTAFSVRDLSIANHDGIQNDASYDICGLTNTATYLVTGSMKTISRSFNVANTSTTTATFVLFQGLRASEAYNQDKEAWQDSHPTAFECEPSFCAKLYSLGLDGVSSAFEAVADSLSIWMRDSTLASDTGSDTNPNPPHVGTVKRWTIHYGVRWWFLALLKEADVQDTMDRAAREMRVGIVGGSIAHVPDLEPDDLLEDNVSLSSHRGNET